MTTMSVSTVQQTTLPATTRSASAARRAVLIVAAVVFATMMPVTMLVAPLKELVADRYHASDKWAHAFMAVNLIGALCFSPLVGTWSDRHGRRRQIAALALAADAVCLSIMAYCPTIETLFAVRFIEGAAHILALSTLMAVAAGWAEPGRRGRVMGLVGACMMLGTTCGTPLGGYLWKHVQQRGAPEWTFLFAGMSAGLAALAALFFLREGETEGARRSRLRDVLDIVRRNPRLLVPYAYAFVDRLCVGVFITTFGLFLARVHGVPPDRRGTMFLAFLAPFALLTYPAGRLVDRIGAAWPIALGSMAFGLVFASYGYIPQSGLYAVMFASGLTSAIMFAPNLSLIADLSPGEQRGAAYTGFNLAGSLGMVFGPMLGGISQAVAMKYLPLPAAYQTTFVITGATEVLCAALTLPFLLRMRRAGTIR